MRLFPLHSEQLWIFHSLKLCHCNRQKWNLILIPVIRVFHHTSFAVNLFQAMAPVTSGSSSCSRFPSLSHAAEVCRIKPKIIPHSVSSLLPHFLSCQHASQLCLCLGVWLCVYLCKPQNLLFVICLPISFFCRGSVNVCWKNKYWLKSFKVIKRELKYQEDNHCCRF